MMVFCTALLVVTVGVASAFTLFDYLGDLAPWTTPMMSRALRLARGVTGFLLGGSLIFGLYRFSPARSLAVHSLVVGSTVTVALFEFARQAFTWYARFAEAAVALYGVLGAFVFLFFWLYYASAIFVLGAEAAWAFEHRGERTGAA
jgi:membrane protein